MAAFDTYDSFNTGIPERDRPSISALQAETWTDLVASRSEEARLRVVENYIREVRERLVRQK